MLISPASDRRTLRQHRQRRIGQQGIALVLTLALVAIVTLLIIAFVTVMRLDRTSTASYSQKLKADQLGRGGLQLIVAQLQNEMGKDAPPDLTYPARPLYTNVFSANILPQSVGTNSAMPSLIKISTNAPAFTGTLMNGLIGSSSSSTTPSVNGRSVSTNIWNQAYLGSFPNNGAAPYWVMMTRGGPTNAASIPFGASTANSVNNAANGNNNYVVGRIAYAVYDEGGLLDINAAGYPTNGSSAALSASQLQAIKGTLAGANLSALGIDPNALTAWRNQTSASSASTYTNYVSSFASTNGFQKVYPGDTTFVSRQDLIQAAQNGTAGLSTSVLTNLATFTRERNAPSWGPSQDAISLGAANNGTGNVYAYKSNALTASSTNVFIPNIRYTAAKTVTGYHIDGTSYTYSVVGGDPLVYRRFPLDRLNWIGPNGPNAAAFGPSVTATQQAAAIQACFGLVWAASAYTSGTVANPSSFNVWQYVGPTGSTEQSKIETLSQVLAESTAREPNFFELLQAGILSGSLGLECHISQGSPYNSFSYFTYHEMSKPLQILRIGSAIISQYESNALPIVIEFSGSGQYGTGSTNAFSTAWTMPWQATGVANLPYLKMFHVLSGYNSTSSMANYLVFGLWNPTQQVPGSTVTRPPVRLHVQGSFEVANNYGASLAANTPVPFNYANTLTIFGYQVNLNDTILLSSSAGNGVNGFVDPHALQPSDLSPTLTAGTSAGMGWATLPPVQGTTYAGYRLPDFTFDPTYTIPPGTIATTPPYTDNVNTVYSWVNLICNLNANLLQPFNFWLEYQNSAGNWIPYDYHAGINDSVHTWFTKDPGFYTSIMGTGAVGSVAATQQLDPVTGVSFFQYIHYFYENLDPRSLRFNYSTVQTPNTTPDWTFYLKSSNWSSATGSSFATYGRTPSQNPQSMFGTGPWAPASLARNNNLTQPGTPGGNTVYASYADPDGVQRIADSGLFPQLRAGGPATYPQVSNLWQGDPYALASTRTADRPIILNRPFNSVGELGYVSRDDPWRSLDFFTANSGDAGLLDLFTVSQSDNPVLAGRINLNSHSSVALNAVLSNTTADIVGTTPAPSTPALSQTAQIASDMVAYTAPGSATGTALLGRDQIATKLVNSLSASDFTVSASNQDEQFVKSRREGVTRALADVGQTRTWNLMIDIVAQAGRYPPTAATLNDFVVEGEKHFWLHVAIDRFTGQVIDSQLETVTQ